LQVTSSKPHNAVVIVDVNNTQALVVLQHIQKFLAIKIGDTLFVDKAEKVINSDRLLTVVLVNSARTSHDRSHPILIGAIRWSPLVLSSALFVVQRSDTVVHQFYCFIDVGLVNLVSKTKFSHRL
jgi:hypothetical protein